MTETTAAPPVADDTEPPVRYDVDGPIAYVTLNRPQYRNAQNSAMTYALDDAFYAAAADDDVKVVVLRARGQALLRRPRHRHARAATSTQSFDRRAGLWWDHVGKPGAESRYARESEVYLGHVPALARAAQAGHRPGARGLHRRRPDARLGV